MILYPQGAYKMNYRVVNRDQSLSQSTQSANDRYLWPVADICSCTAHVRF
jgi:hypothetical protein